MSFVVDGSDSEEAEGPSASFVVGRRLSSLQPTVRATQLLRARTLPPPLPRDTEMVEFRVPDITIPTAATTYWCQAVDLRLVGASASAWDNKRHVVRVCVCFVTELQYSSQCALIECSYCLLNFLKLNGFVLYFKDQLGSVLKLIGGAGGQRRKRDARASHGTFPLRGATYSKRATL